ncbi:MAG TPA: PKD domain-containing protein, partial [Candidatus Methanoperedens sp.]|nr:PKD domain-containing protein [Candidatus Methanoperedens sp.]
VPDDSWTAWDVAHSGGPLPDPPGRFLQYRATFSSATPGSSPVLRELRISPPDPARRVIHTTSEDFATTPIELSDSFAVDFAAADQVSFGVYTASGRSLLLDLLPLRRAGAHVAAWTDRTRVWAGDAVALTVVADGGGLLGIFTPWESLTLSLAGAGTTTIPVVTPWNITSGSYDLVVEFCGERVSVPIEIDGYEVRVLEADLGRAALLPGEATNLTLLLQSNQDIAHVTIEGWLTSGFEMQMAFSVPCALAWGLNRFEIPIPTGELRAGTWTLFVTVSGSADATAPALHLAGAEVWFEILPVNRPPVADAGADLVTIERSWVRLDGRASSDPDGDPLSWLWVQTAGPAVALLGATTAQPLFFAPAVGRGGDRLIFSLQVSDGYATSAADLVEVAVADANRPPVAVAGPDLTRRVGETAVMDATGSHDPDGDLLEFLWSLTARPEGSAAALVAADQLAAALVPDVPGEYAVTLVVRDGIAESAPDVAVVSTINSRPRADAGEDRTVRAGERVEFDGSGSDDADGDQLSFSWTLAQQPPGSVAGIDGADGVRPTLLVDRCGTYLAELVVDDGALASEPDTVRLDCANTAPVADAGSDRAARLGERVVLDGSASHDVDGDPLSFAWAFATRPAGSAAALDDPAALAPSFTADLVGNYAINLVVDDGSAESLPDGVSIAIGTDVAQATIGLTPATLRLGVPAPSLRARIELPAGFSAREIDPAAAAITAVGRRVLAKPVRRIAAKGAVITDADRDGRPEMNLYFPTKPLLRYLRAGTKAVLSLKGPLATWGRFVGSGALKIAP